MLQPKSQTGHQTAESPLPQPSEDALAHSQRLVNSIRSQIEEAGGQIPFCDYMQMALYSPGLGYYSAGMQKFGKSGDFITAPEISPLFAQVLAIQIEPILRQLPSPSLLEVGAGSGRLAGDLIKELAARQSLPKNYYILEVSPDLQDRQKQFLKQHVPDYYAKIIWLTQLPNDGFNGVVIANELLDAMPVHLIKLEDDKLYERFVGIEKDKFIWHDRPSDKPELVAYQHHIQSLRMKNKHLDDGAHCYITEVNLLANHWIQSITDIIEQGALLLIDYGYPENEYFHPQRHMGTLMCHYQHHRHDDPFYLPGLQDITAHVNFSAIAQSAVQSGLEVKGYTTQAHFLLAGGLEELVKRVDINDVSAYSRMAQQVKMLTLPDEMGEIFKVIYLTKGNVPPLSVFQQWDMRERL